MHPAAPVTRHVIAAVPDGRCLAATTSTGLGTAPWPVGFEGYRLGLAGIVSHFI